MPTPTCSKCRRVIPADDINVAQDVAYCRECNISYRLSELTASNDVSAGVDLQRPPGGAWYMSNGAGTVIGASNRSVSAAAALLFFALFWNGIVSVFVVLAIAGTLQDLHIHVPAWFPNPGNGGGFTGVGMTIFLWLFLTPFIGIGLMVAFMCLSCLFGRTEARIESSRGTVFTGVGPLGWKRTFDASQVKGVRSYQTRNNNGNDTNGIVIEIRDGKQVKLGTLLTGERWQFVLGALQRSLGR